MLNLIGEGIAKGAKKALQETAEDVGEKAVAKTAKRTAKEAALDISNKVAQKYGDKADEIMAYYGSDIAKKGDNSFLGRLLSGQKVENPLVMYHSVDSSKLRDMLELADATYSDYAIPNPSVQVVDPTKNVGTSYGDVILLGNKSIPGGINKYSGKPDLYGGKYNLFSRDIYSPRKPNIEWSKGTPTIAGTRKRATPDNISEYMTKQGTKAVEGNWSTPASLAAATSKRFKNPLDAIKNSDLLQSQGGLQRAFNDWDNEVSDSVQTLLDKYMVDNPDVNPYDYSDYIMSELKYSMAGRKAWDDPYGINTTEEGRNIVKNLTSKAKELPTAYFEGKPSRAIPLEEFGGVILPEGFSDTYVGKALKDAGLEIKGWYDPENYEESLQNTLVGLTKGSDRLTTPYLMSIKPDFDPDYETRMAIDNLSNSVKRVGSKDVAPVDKKTLPVGWDKLEKRMDINYIDNEIAKLAGKSDIHDVTQADMKRVLDELGYGVDPDVVATEKALGTYDEQQVLYNTLTDAIDDQLSEEASMKGGELVKEFLNGRNGVLRNKFAGPEYFYFGPEGRAGYLDAEFSDRLGIGRSNTPHSDDLNNYVAKDAAGDFFAGGIGVKPGPLRRGEDEVSTIAHERLHSFQSTAKGYDKGVQDAYSQLHEELAPYKLNKKQIKDYHGKLHGRSSLDYYLNDHEQEARMLQEYLDRAGYTKVATDRDKARRRFVAGRSEEFDEGIDKAFDNFFDKLRTLSKAGVALPAVGLALLLGENYNNKKKENG